MAEEKELQVFARRVEEWAIQQAHKSRDIDKTDQIRIWALARRQRGLPFESSDWKRAYDEAVC